MCNLWPTGHLKPSNILLTFSRFILSTLSSINLSIKACSLVKIFCLQWGLVKYLCLQYNLYLKMLDIPGLYSHSLYNS